jgi:hypothetical protein
MDALNQYLADSSADATEEVDALVKRASVVSAMTRGELQELNAALEPTPVVPMVKEATDENFMKKVAFVASVGAGERITPDMIKESGVWGSLLAKYLKSGVGQLKSLATGSLKSGLSVSRRELLKRHGQNIVGSYKKGATGAATAKGGVLKGIGNVYKENPLVGMGTGAAVAGVGAKKLLKRKDRNVSMHNYNYGG